MFENFWADPERWPRATATHMSLPDAAIRIGQARFGNEWTGDEPITCIIESLPPRFLSKRRHTLRAHQVLVANMANYQPKPETERDSSGRTGIKRYVFTDAEWEQAQAIGNEQATASVHAWQRFEAVKKEILTACTAGEIVTAARPRGSIKMAQIDPDVWSMVDPQAVFERCEINFDRLAGQLIDFLSDIRSVFVLRTSLDQYVAKITGASSAETAFDNEAASAAKPSAIPHCVSKATTFLQANPGLTKSELKTALKEAGLNVSGRQFDMNVWKQSREAAGLSPDGKKGPRRKS